ncbi:hypothetical protein WJX73_007351 [Symbiochloris irregularis]|uniref:RING-type E3 ubiquitin transferase n=1 Tax=Symbiochloris irregularis TaxID=706552 RepID=A0AAW1P6A0_9CHLO
MSKERPSAVCEHFRRGECAYGDRCWKRHEKQSSEAKDTRMRYPPLVPATDARYKSRMCAFAEAGLCGRGSECSFAHSRSEIIDRAKSTQTDQQDVVDPIFCPITQEVMQHPVLLSDGFSYECSAIEDWLLRGHTRSPMTNAELITLGGKVLIIPNHSLRALIAYCTGAESPEQ